MDYELELKQIRLTYIKTVLICLSIIFSTIYATNKISTSIDYQTCVQFWGNEKSPFDMADVAGWYESMQDTCNSDGLNFSDK